MYRTLLIALTAVLMTAIAVGQQKTYDFRNLTPRDIEELKAARHAFYTQESAAKERAIKEALLEERMSINANQADYDVRYYGINIKLDFGTSTIQASVDYKLRSNVPALNAIDLNLHSQLIVDSVRVAGAPASFTHASNLLMITTPVPYTTGQEFAMAVYYHGTPYFNGEHGMYFGTLWGYAICYTNCEPFGSRYWWPCKDYPIDKPDSLDLHIDYPSTYKVVSNGKVMSDVPSGTGRKLTHFKHSYPITTYLVAISCANFVYGQQTWDHPPYSMPVVTYTLPNAGAAKSSFDTWMIPVLDIFSEKYGTYPFATEKAGNAHFGWGGAMEHQTCSFYSPSFYDSWVIAHETSHQWWGDMITCKTFNHIWLNEGFASYSEPIFFEDYYQSSAVYHSYMQTQKYLGPGTIYVENLETDDIFDNNLSYDKASWVLHMLRGVLGDTTFFRVLGDYYNSPYKYGSLTTEEFSSFVSARAGIDLGWFFQQWIYGDGHPDYSISWQCQPDTGGGFRLAFIIQQTQSGGTYFKMPVRTTFVTTGGSKDTIIWNEGSTDVKLLWFPDSVTNVSFDPEEWILRTVTVVPFSMHIATTTLPDGQVGVPYSVKLEAVGGVPPYHWSLIGGDLPYGLTFVGDTVGTISGTPTWPATFYYTLRVADSDSPPKTETRDYAHKILPAPPTVIVGDADGSGTIDISDVVFLVHYIFAGGPAPDPTRRGDADCSGTIDISDAVTLVNYIFGGGPQPNCP